MTNKYLNFSIFSSVWSGNILSVSNVAFHVFLLRGERRRNQHKGCMYKKSNNKITCINTPLYLNADKNLAHALTEIMSHEIVN